MIVKFRQRDKVGYERVVDSRSFRAGVVKGHVKHQEMVRKFVEKKEKLEPVFHVANSSETLLVTDSGKVDRRRDLHRRECSPDF